MLRKRLHLLIMKVMDSRMSVEMHIGVTAVQSVTVCKTDASGGLGGQEVIWGSVSHKYAQR